MPTVTTSKKLNGELKTLIIRVITEVLSDSDFGLELSAAAKTRLRKAASSQIPFSKTKNNERK